MRQAARWCGIGALVLLGALALQAAPAEEAVSVVIKKAAVERKTFDPAKPPPVITPMELAICQANSSCDGDITSEVLEKTKVGNSWQVTIKITRLRAFVGLTSVIWLPKDAPPWLAAHEEAHRTINERIYAGARDAALAAAREAAAETYTGTGPSVAAAQSAAATAAGRKLGSLYEQRMPATWRRVNEIFDGLTAHGFNRKIKVEDAIVEAFRQYEKETAARAGTRP